VRRGALYSPTVIDHDDAIRIANGTAYGLSSSICTNRLDYITRFVTELHVGSVNVREVPGYRLELTPFGGIKDSGLGYKEGVQEAMKSFTNVKTYSLPW
jgi:aldehyde dehydrogenase (NAD+)